MRRAARAAAGLAAVVAVSWVVGVLNPVPQPVPRGDQLGMEDGETRSEYAARAALTLPEANDGGKVFALVSFTQPVSAGQAADAVEGVGRVNAVVAKQYAPVAVPEPTYGATRADVIDAAVDGPVAALVVHDRGEVLRAVGGRQGVLAVEALPPDAVWGSFGVREMR